MTALEYVCVVIVVLYLALRGRIDAHPARFAYRMLALAVAAWIAEDTVIAAYGYYQYAPTWTVFLHHVPLLVVCIWPVVIHSAWDVARALSPDRRGLVGVFVIVLGDAALIEPVAVSAGLWSWNHPGLFGVPLIGVAGWAIFAVGAGTCLDLRGWRFARLIVVAPLVTHIALLVAYWGLFRWVRPDGPIAPAAGVLAAWAAALVACAVTLRRPLLVPRALLWLRLPGAVFFLFLLVRHDNSAMLHAYIAAFPLPYLTALWRQRRGGPTPSHLHEDTALSRPGSVV